MKILFGGLAAVVLMISLTIWFRTPARPYYSIHMANMTHHDLDGVCVYYGSQMAAAKGILVRGGEASYGSVTLPVPDEAEVRWDDAGVHHAPKVKLSGIVPPCPRRMNVYFIIHEDESVAVKIVRSDDLNGNIEATKGIEKLWKKNAPL